MSFRQVSEDLRRCEQQLAEERRVRRAVAEALDYSLRHGTGQERLYELLRESAALDSQESGQ